MKEKQGKRYVKLTQKVWRNQDHEKRNTESLHPGKYRKRWERYTIKTGSNNSSQKTNQIFNTWEELRSNQSSCAVKENLEIANQKWSPSSDITFNKSAEDAIVWLINEHHFSMGSQCQSTKEGVVQKREGLKSSRQAFLRSIAPANSPCSMRSKLKTFPIKAKKTEAPGLLWIKLSKWGNPW